MDTTALTDEDEIAIASRISNIMTGFVDSESDFESEDAFLDDLENCTVWVQNLASNISEMDLESRFEIYGPVESVRILHASRCARIVFHNAADAEQSLDLEGTKIGVNVVTLNIGIASPHLWIGNLVKVTPAMLKSAFERFGPVTSVKTLPYKKIAFVNFERASDALNAMETLSGTKLGKKSIFIHFQWPELPEKPTTPADSSEPECKQAARVGNSQHLTPCRSLFVGNIGMFVSQARLVSLFSRFGQVERVEFYSNQGFAFIVYHDIRIASWVREQMSLLPPTIAGQSLEVTFGRPLPSNDGQPPSGYEYQVHSPCNPSAPPKFVQIKIN